MPLIVTAGHPAQWTLESDGIFVIPAAEAVRQDIRPLRLLLLDLMPEAAGLQAQLARLLGNTALQVELTVAHLDAAVPPAGSQPLAPRSFRELADQRFDGLVVSHAAVGDRPCHEAPCWDELRDALDWSLDHVHAALFLGWSSLAALDHFYGIATQPAPRPLIGVLRQRVRRRQSYLLRGFDDAFDVPVSAHRLPDVAAIADSPWLEVLAEADESGPYVVRNRSRRQVFVAHLPHYEPGHLVLDQRRQPHSGEGTNGRRFTLNDCTWRAHAQALFSNWLNYYVYQASPYRLDQLTPMPAPLASERFTGPSRA